MTVDIDGKPFRLTREDKARQIVWTKGAIVRLNDSEYEVESQSSFGSYLVQKYENSWKCNCPDYLYRHAKCKHILSVELSIELRKEVEQEAKVIGEVNVLVCRYCNSENIVRDGIRKNKYGNIQKYNCKDCSRYFTVNVGFEWMHATPEQITGAMQLYFSGESFRSVQKFLQLQGLKVSHQTVYNWIKKYVSLMEGYLDRITPEMLSNTWRTDELFLKIKGDTKYLYAVMDDRTRFLIAQQVADSKYTEDIRPLFKEASKFAKRKPRVLISDGAYNFHTAYVKEYQTTPNYRTQHVRHIHLRGDRNNNKMERLNGEIRDREKTMRGIKKMDSPILVGYKQYHNYFREHQGLENKTPAEIAGIKIEGQNKMITVIQNAALRKKLAN